MKIIQFATLFALLSVSSPLVQASDGSSNTKDIIQKQENVAMDWLMNRLISAERKIQMLGRMSRLASYATKKFT